MCMYSRAEIQQIQRAVASAAPAALVLLGGSFSRGDAVAASDIDLYCVAPMWRLLRYRAPFKALLAQHNRFPVQLMLIPKLYYRLGWLHISGYDMRGVLHESPQNASLIIRNSIKLALYYYLMFVATQNPNWLRKSQVQAARAWQFMGVPTRRAEAADARLLLALVETGKKYFSWSLPNYVIYNLHFLRKGSALFIFKNPDKLVLDRLINALALPPHELRESLESIKKIVLPIIALSF